MYLLDADVFIQAKRLHYGLDIAPGFWDWLIQANSSGRVFTVKKIADEIAAGGDDLSNWFTQHVNTAFALDYEPADQTNLATLANWATSTGFTQAAQSDFLTSGDYYLIAQAATRGYTVVTHEVIADPNAKKRIKIPNACEYLNVPCVRIFDVMRTENVRLHL